MPIDTKSWKIILKMSNINKNKSLCQKRKKKKKIKKKHLR